MRHRALPAIVAGLWVFASGCSSPVENKAPKIHLLTDVVGLDVVQISGGDEIDFIVDSLGAGAAWLDYDGDGDADLYLVQGATRDAPAAGPPDVLLRNDGIIDGRPHFTDVTEQSGLGDRRWSFGVATADYDNDGDTDLFVSNWGVDRLYRNDGNGHFTDVAVDAGLAEPGWSTSAAWSDIDRDGDLDLYVSRYVEFEFTSYPGRGERLSGDRDPCVWKNLEVFCGPRNLLPAVDRLFRNDGDSDGDGIPTFVEIGQSAGIANGAWYGLAVHFFDADGDGDDDIYVANDSVRNGFFVNDGSGTFEDQSILAGLAYNEQGGEQAGMGIASTDYDHDGDIDLVVSNFSHDHHTLYRATGDGWYLDASFSSGLGAASFADLGWGLLFADLDHDGWEDLFVAHGHVYPQVDQVSLGTRFRQLNGLYHNDGTGGFDRLGKDFGSALTHAASSRCVLPEDFDGDGDLDLLVTHHNEAPTLLLNDLARGHWLQVSLQGTLAPRDGIGSRIEIRWMGDDDSTETRQAWVRRDASYLSSRRPIAHFGLGDVEQIERLTVYWTSGSVTTIDGPEIDQLIRVVEAEDLPSSNSP